MSKLEQVKEKGQQVAEAIATVLKMEVEIIDDQLMRIAGTGQVRSSVGSKLLRGFVNKHVLKTGQSIFISNTGEHQICQTCPLATNCFYKAYIVYPIKINNNTIGTLSLIAFNDTQRETLCSSSQSLTEFISRMADLLVGKILERDMWAEKIVIANQLTAIVDSVYEGVVAIDEEGIVTHFNKSAEALVDTSKEAIIGKPVTTVLPGLPLKQVLQDAEGYKSKEIFVHLKNLHFHFVSTAKPILDEDGSIVGAVATFKDFSEAQKAAYKIIARQHTINFDDIIGKSKAITQVKRQSAKIAGSNSTVLIVGESGTGKEVFARAIHTASTHANHPFVAINCGAIPESLLESELFGYEDGAFTGAKRGGKPGKIELANGGTLFLDEIGNMSLYLQAKLLRVLQEKQIERVGGTKIIPVDIRVIAATNSNLNKMVDRGEFREDLYYRLSVIPLTIPPLRERKEDIPQLLNHYLKRHSQLLGKTITGFTPQAIQICIDYSWPGNVRELINTVEYAANLEDQELIQPSSLPPRIKKKSLAAVPVITNLVTIDELEKQAISMALQEFGWTDEGKEQAANVLGISRATIYRKINKYKLSPNGNGNGNGRPISLGF
ncbi:MAG: sigma 54-interacting transcriptional regulator [Bacillota bacterium]|nr:sigma 54-interacting transcriptional regulator [Bacillota bacterium]